MHHEKEIEIGLVVYPGAQQAAVLGLADLFGIAAGHGAPSGPALRVTYWRQPAPEAAPERDDGGAAGVLHALIVPPTLAEPPGEAESAVLAAWLRERHAAGAMLASVCVGAFVLAGTGLMAGRRLTTPHAYAAALRRRHPDVRVSACASGARVSCWHRDACRSTAWRGKWAMPIRGRCARCLRASPAWHRESTGAGARRSRARVPPDAVPAAQVHAAAMASLEFGYATVRSTRDWLGGA